MLDLVLLIEANRNIEQRNAKRVTETGRRDTQLNRKYGEPQHNA